MRDKNIARKTVESSRQQRGIHDDKSIAHFHDIYLHTVVHGAPSWQKTAEILGVNGTFFHDLFKKQLSKVFEEHINLLKILNVDQPQWRRLEKNEEVTQARQAAKEKAERELQADYYLPLAQLRNKKRDSINTNYEPVEPQKITHFFSMFDPLFPAGKELSPQEHYLYKEANKILSDTQKRNDYTAFCLEFFSNENNLPKPKINQNPINFENTDTEETITKKLKII